MYDDVPVEGKTQVGGLDYNIAAALCYLPVSPINLISQVVWIATEKQSKFVRFHALQGLIFGLGFGFGIVLLSVLSGVLSAVLAFVLPNDLQMVTGIASLLISLLLLAVLFGVFGLTLFAMYKAFTKQFFRIPMVAGLADRFV